MLDRIACLLMKGEYVMGAKPSRGTPADRRLAANKGKPKPMPKPKPNGK